MRLGKTTQRRKARLLLGAGVVGMIALAALASVIAATNGRGTQQPIQFNHRLHVEEVEEPCSTCHLFFQTRERAGRPTVAVCGECHDETLTESTEEAKLVRFVEEGAELPWLRVTRLPAHVRFSHPRHVVVAKLECARCHGNIAELEQPPTRPPIKIDMNFCIDCHRSLRFRVTARSVKALKTAGASPELVDNLQLILGNRYASGRALLDSFEEVLPRGLPDPQRELVLSHVESSESVTVDCIACHR